MGSNNNVSLHLADLRKKLLWLWITIAGLIIALFIFMTLVNTFEGVELAAWVWALGTLLPPLTLLFLDIILNPFKVVKKSTFWLIYYCALSYLLLALATIVGMQAWLDTHTSQNIADYFQQSYLWILPFQGLLLVGFGILFFQHKKTIQASEKMPPNYIQQKAEYAHQFGNDRQQKAFDLLLNNDFNNLFEFLKIEYNEGTELSGILLLQSQYNAIQQKLDFNTADPTAMQIEHNRIFLALTSLIEKL